MLRLSNDLNWSNWHNFRPAISREQSKSENVEFNYGNYSALIGRLGVNRSNVMWWCRSCEQLISYEQPTLNASSMVLQRSDDDDRRRRGRHKCWKQFRNHNQKLHHAIIINRRLIPLHSLLHAFPRPNVQSSDLLLACMCNFFTIAQLFQSKISSQFPITMFNDCCGTWCFFPIITIILTCTVTNFLRVFEMFFSADAREDEQLSPLLMPPRRRVLEASSLILLLPPRPNFVINAQNLMRWFFCRWNWFTFCSNMWMYMRLMPTFHHVHHFSSRVYDTVNKIWQ